MHEKLFLTLELLVYLVGVLQEALDLLILTDPVGVCLELLNHGLG